ncbi:DUF1129 family protein [Virgibacillus ainsalahensis]
MDAKELIQANNIKRKQLTKENLEYYEEMLLYVRLSYDIAEQEMEEILAELLDHLLESQAEGKTAEDVFGREPKRYANEIIGELPKMVTKERMKFFIMGALYFLAASTIFSGGFALFNHYVLDMETLTEVYHVGTVILKVLLSVPIAFLLLYVLVQYLRWACFKKINKVKEFFLLWGYGVVSFGIFMLVVYVTPDIGPVIEFPFYIVLLLGAVLFLAAHMMRKAI